MDNAAKIEQVKKALLAMQRHSWEQGVTAQAFLELGDMDTVILLAKDAAYRQRDDGRLALLNGETAVTDPAVNGEPVMAAARVTGDQSLQASVDKLLHYLLETAPRTADGTLHHLTNSSQVWVDSIYMLAFLAIAGHADEALRQIEGIKRVLWNPEKKLFSHKWDADKQALERADFWGVGNGWAAAGMARVIDVLPDGAARRQMIASVTDLLDGCLAYLREDGFFHDVVDDSNTFVETNLSQMLAYTIYRGIKAGWLSETYREAADKMRAAAHSKLDAYGLLHDVCGAPTFDRPGIAPEGQAFFLLMESAVLA